MTEQPAAAEAWDFHAGDRLRKARENAGYDGKKFGEVTGLDRTTIRKWEHSAEVAPLRVLNLYKMATDAPSVDWLRNGTLPEPPDGGGAEHPLMDAKQLPTAYKSQGLPRRTLRVVGAEAA